MAKNEEIAEALEIMFGEIAKLVMFRGYSVADARDFVVARVYEDYPIIAAAITAHGVAA